MWAIHFRMESKSSQCAKIKWSLWWNKGDFRNGINFNKDRILGELSAVFQRKTTKTTAITFFRLQLKGQNRMVVISLLGLANKFCASLRGNYRAGESYWVPWLPIHWTDGTPETKGIGIWRHICWAIRRVPCSRWRDWKKTASFETITIGHWT